MFDPVLDWWKGRSPLSRALDSNESLTISRQSQGFSSKESVSLEKGHASIVRVQYGQVHLKTAKDPLFLVVGGRDTLIRIVVKAQQPGVRAPALRLVLDHMARGRLFDGVLKAEGALPSKEEPEKADFLKTPLDQAYLAIVPGKKMLPGHYRVWIGPHDARTVAMQPYQEKIEVKPVYTLPITVMPFQWRDGVEPAMTQHTPELYRLMFERYFPFIQPVVRIRPFAVISAMNENDFNENQFHMDGTTMMIADQARKGLYVGVYHKKKHNWLTGERVGTSSGSLLVVQDQLGEAELDVLAHEIGHSMGLKHSPCGNPEEPVDTHFPYPNAGMGLSWGLDWHTQPDHIQLVDPRGTKDLMSYCFERRFISDYNYSYAHRAWLPYRAQNHLALMGDIYALQIFAYPPAQQMEIHGVGDLVDSLNKGTQRSKYIFEVVDRITGRRARVPALIQALPTGEKAFVARTPAIGWLAIDRISLIDSAGQVIMSEVPAINYLNRENANSIKWVRHNEGLFVTYNGPVFDRGIVVYEAANGVIATLAFLNGRGEQRISLKGLPAGGAFWAVLASTTRDAYGRRGLITSRQPWSNIVTKPAGKNR